MRIYREEKWERWFALWPVDCGTCGSIRGTAWLETVERKLPGDIFELVHPWCTYTYRFIDDPEDAKLPHRWRSHENSSQVD